jgi:N-acylglucosamine-6-phosphate 2-epimerase
MARRSDNVNAIRNGLVVSCQVPVSSPLARPSIIAAMALAAEKQGAAGVRINGATNISLTRKKVKVPIIGIEKIRVPRSAVYITPTFESLRRTYNAGADIVAMDFTARRRPGGEDLKRILERARRQFDVVLMADVATLEEGLTAAQLGADLVGTTLFGYTEETSHRKGPAFALLRRLVRRLDVPVILEGGVRSPRDVRKAFDLGAHAVVVGTAITNMEWLTRWFVAATPHHGSCARRSQGRTAE